MRQLFLICLIFPLSANPKGAIHSGDVSIHEMGNLVEIEAPHRAVIDWDSFSIGGGEITRFIQPSIDAAVLNRVVGSEISQLFGLLQANGQVYLVNPNGIVIGKEGQIQAASFVGSTIDLHLDDFLQGSRLRCDKEGKGALVNLGTIEALHGPVILLSREIRNEGKVEGKDVSCFTGEEFLLDPTGDGLILIVPKKEQLEGLETRLQKEGPYGIALGNEGTLIVRENGKIYLGSPNGSISIEQALLDASGKEGGGEVRLEAGSAVVIGSEARIKANAIERGDGGNVFILSDGAVQFKGEISARGFGKGGFVEVSGKERLVYEGFADLSPMDGGQFGTLLLDPKNISIEPGGGAFTGMYTFADSAASNVTISGSNLATAINAANVILQANTDITVQDTVTATTLGNGLTLQAGRSITFAAAGQVTLNGGAFSATINDNGAVTNRDAGAASFTMNSMSTLSTQGGTISIGHGSNTGGNVGGIDITGATINSGNANITMVGVAPTGVSVGVSIATSSITMTGAGTISITGTGGLSNASNCYGILLSSSIIPITNGALSLTGTGGGNGSGSSNTGIYTSAGLISSSGSGTITLNGTGGSGGTTFNVGCYLGGQIISSGTGEVAITGYAGGGYSSSGIYFANSEIDIFNGNLHAIGYGQTSTGSVYDRTGIITNFETISSTGSGSIILEGTGGTTTSTLLTFINVGVYLNGGSTVSSGTGAITVTGQGGAGAFSNVGINATSSPSIQSSGSGAITLNGTGGANGADNTYDNHGLDLFGTSISSSGGGAITITGTGGSGTQLNQRNRGLFFHDGTNIQSTGSGGIVLTGTGNGSDGYGVWFLAPSSAATTGSNNLSITGTAEALGINLEGSLSTVNGDISLTATGITATASIQSTGSGDIAIASNRGDVTIAATSTSTGTISLLALQGSSNIILTDNFSCGGNFILAANNNITFNTGISVDLTGAGSFVVDQQNGTTYVPPPDSSGVFTNNGTITSTSNNLAIYCVYGPQEPVGAPVLTPVNQFGNLSPAIETWDQNVAIPALAGKYETSYSGGGPVHGAGFGTHYIPGNGVFGSIVVWYKETLPGFPTAVRPIDVSAALTQTIANQAAEQSSATGTQQPTTTPDPKKGCRSPAVAVQAL
jgi:filamentous hemagglutinin family protein